MVYKPKRKYEWWDGYSRCVDANIVGGIVEQLEATNGSVTREDFLEVSRPEDAPTHDLFEWDDSVAAEKWRLRQSTTIINSLRVVYEDKEGEEKKISAFIQTSAPGEHTAYENIHHALKDAGKRDVVLNRLRGELDAFIIRNQSIEELSEILEEAAEKCKRRRKAKE